MQKFKVLPRWLWTVLANQLPENDNMWRIVNKHVNQSFEMWLFINPGLVGNMQHLKGVYVAKWLHQKKV